MNMQAGNCTSASLGFLTYDFLESNIHQLLQSKLLKSVSARIVCMDYFAI